MPRQPHARQHLEDHGKQRGNHRKADQRVEHGQHHAGVAPHAAPVFSSSARAALTTSDTISRKASTSTMPNDSRRAHHVPHGAVGEGRDLPDGVEAGLEFGKHGGGAKQQKAAGDQGREAAFFLVLRAGQHQLDGFRALRAEPAQLRKQLALRACGP
jgi:hypothetical protein